MIENLIIIIQTAEKLEISGIKKEKHFYSKSHQLFCVLPQAFNYLINLNLEEAKKIKLVDVTNLVPDERIEEILKKYSPK